MTLDILATADLRSLVFLLDQHCRTPQVQVSSNPSSVRCIAYDRLVEREDRTLSYLRERWDDELLDATTRYHAFPLLVFDIAGERITLPDDLAGRVQPIHDYLKDWISQNA